MLYIARGSRGDVAFAVSRLGCGASNWTGKYDRWLQRIVRYLWHTRDFGLIFRSSPSDLKNLRLRCWFDADHAGDPSHSKSTTGFIVWLVGDTAMICLDWTFRLQTSTSKSTGEAEIVVGADALCRSVWPLQQILLELYGYDVPLELGTDSSTAKLEIERGFSKSMRSLKKHQRTSSGLMMEALDKEDDELNNLDSEANTSDVCTKPLGSVLHTKHRAGFPISSDARFV